MKAFSLIEVMVASSLFLVTVVGVVSATQTGSAVFEHQRKLTQAVSVGEFAMEEMLLRYTTSVDLEISAVENAGGIITSSTPKSRCIGVDLAPTTGCATRTMTPQSGFSSDIDALVGNGTRNYGITWVVGRPPNLESQRHVVLLVSWIEGNGLVRSVQLQTYRP